MRYLVRARVKPGLEHALLKAIHEETLGRGSVAEGEYLRNMQDARLCADESTRWVEVCYCPTPLQKSGPTGRNTSSSPEFRMRMTAASAATRTAQSRGPAATAIVPSAWK